jgi:hypothetical protein
LEVVHLDGISGAATGAVLYRGSGTNLSPTSSGNCGTNSADPAGVGGAFLARSDIFIHNQIVLGSLRGVAAPMHRLYGIYTNGAEIGDSGYVLTLVSVSPFLNNESALGSLPVDRNGPW